LSSGCLVNCHLALALLFWAIISFRIIGKLFDLAENLERDEESVNEFCMLVVS